MEAGPESFQTHGVQRINTRQQRKKHARTEQYYDFNNRFLVNVPLVMLLLYSRFLGNAAPHANMAPNENYCWQNYQEYMHGTACVNREEGEFAL